MSSGPGSGSFVWWIGGRNDQVRPEYFCACVGANGYFKGVKEFVTGTGGLG